VASPEYRCTEFAVLSCPEISPLLKKPNNHVCLSSNSVFYIKKKNKTNHFSLLTDNHLKMTKLSCATVCKCCSSSTFSVLLYVTGGAANGGDSIIFVALQGSSPCEQIRKGFAEKRGETVAQGDNREQTKAAQQASSMLLLPLQSCTMQSGDICDPSF